MGLDNIFFCLNKMARVSRNWEDRTNDDIARKAVDAEARKLIDELYSINKTLKPGTIERERKEDAIYQKLHTLAEMIQKKNWTQGNMQELYQLITNKQMKKPTLYSDDYNMFTQYPDDSNTHLFLQEMVTDFKIMKPEEAQNLLSDPSIDGKKEILKSLLQNCQREKILHKGVASTCKDCWPDILRKIFFMVSEMLTVELQNRSHQISVMTKNQQISTQDAIELSGLLKAVTEKLDAMINRADKITKKKDWITLVESIFQLLIYMVNEIMMRFVMSQRAQLALAENRPVQIII